jgi:phosphatidylglycerophosphatase C
MEKRVFAVFDFDGTITNKDSFADMIQSIFGRFFFFRLTALSFIQLILYVSGIWSNTQAKEYFFTKLFYGMGREEYQEKCRKYSLEKLPRIIRPDALKKIKWHKSKGHKLVLITASIEDWVSPWAEKNGFETVLATKAEIKNGKVTGKFATENCYGVQKLRRFRQKYPDRKHYFIYAYGDSKGDRELLADADRAFYRKF